MRVLHRNFVLSLRFKSISKLVNNQNYFAYFMWPIVKDLTVKAIFQIHLAISIY